MVIDYEVILATFNGSNYIVEQLNSIASQSIPPSRIIISDDNSSDDTLAVAYLWSRQNKIPVTFMPKVYKNLGCCRNFERLLDFTTTQYVMIADQDDVWDVCKAEYLFEEIFRLNKNSFGTQMPLLVYSDLKIVDQNGNFLFNSFYSYQNINPLKNDFLSLAIQNVVTGCTCLVNQECIRAALPFPDSVILHDWWLGLVASKLGQLSFISLPLVNYRQHDTNLVGAKSFYRLLFDKLDRLLYTQFIDDFMHIRLAQLNVLLNRFAEPNSQHCLIVNKLFSVNPLARFVAALRLRLCCHGPIRTVVFYVFLLLWNPTISRACI